MDIAIKILDSRLGDIWPLPQYGTPMAAAVDLRAMIDETLTLEPGQAALIPSGIAIHMNEPSMCSVILPRSGLGHKHGIVMGNGTGLIDADYQGPLMISAFNRSGQPFVIEPGDRIAQMVFLPILRPNLVVVDDFEKSQRGEGGFGHTGVK